MSLKKFFRKIISVDEIHPESKIDPQLKRSIDRIISETSSMEDISEDLVEARVARKLWVELRTTTHKEQTPHPNLAISHWIVYLMWAVLEEVNNIHAKVPNYRRDELTKSSLYEYSLKVAYEPEEFFRKYPNDSNGINWYPDLKKKIRGKMKWKVRDIIRTLPGCSTFGSTNLGVISAAIPRLAFMSIPKLVEMSPNAIQQVLINNGFSCKTGDHQRLKVLHQTFQEAKAGLTKPIYNWGDDEYIIVQEQWEKLTANLLPYKDPKLLAATTAKKQLEVLIIYIDSNELRKLLVRSRATCKEGDARLLILLYQAFQEVKSELDKQIDCWGSDELNTVQARWKQLTANLPPYEDPQLIAATTVKRQLEILRNHTDSTEVREILASNGFNCETGDGRRLILLYQVFQEVKSEVNTRIDRWGDDEFQLITSRYNHRTVDLPPYQSQVFLASNTKEQLEQLGRWRRTYLDPQVTWDPRIPNRDGTERQVDEFEFIPTPERQNSSERAAMSILIREYLARAQDQYTRILFFKYGLQYTTLEKIAIEVNIISYTTVRYHIIKIFTKLREQLHVNLEETINLDTLRVVEEEFYIYYADLMESFMTRGIEGLFELDRHLLRQVYLDQHPHLSPDEHNRIHQQLNGHVSRQVLIFLNLPSFAENGQALQVISQWIRTQLNHRPQEYL